MEQLCFPFYEETEPVPQPEIDPAKIVAGILMLTERYVAWANRFTARVNAHAETMRAGLAT